MIERNRRANRRTFGKLLLLVAFMFGFGYALVPFYRAFCNLTGINRVGDKSSLALVRNTQVDESRAITIEFDANARGAFRFEPLQRSMTVHPGQIAQVLYQVSNRTDHAVRLQAIPSYAPAEAASHFKKIECFCFTQQSLQPNESRQMPVVFVVDPKLPKGIPAITLSYTSFELGATSTDAATDQRENDDG
ncbi:cytochrome C oxidase assembly protein [Pandoraea thiooxydans]|uniref:Cytochrome c oxidase assembly protein CtaG n=1 Tax=Pandoraea thiooxydans TaxID=445709 RepID=A0A0G3EWU6_9BURK|nr:cytochrome c oxidase assembly protein [Pandoraea thiooxydans]AKJ69241.1 cytochrome c oxidase assembly protein [Pandoraea thiooxydans]APR96845.1 cytochrome C oxidase assembly protein [Pandoraea thiooxydans]